MSLKEKSARNLASKSTKLFADLPAMPATLIETDGALEWNASLQEFWGKFKQALGENLLDGDLRTTKLSTTFSDSAATLTAAINEEKSVRANADGALATDISNVIASYTAADTTLSAAITAEATARATATGYLEGKYTLTVAAGNVVTGMNITSASGPGTTISEVTFQTDRFKIYNGTLGLAPFQIVGSKIRLTGDVEIDGALLLSGTLSLTNLADRSLANLDSTANTKLAGIATGADVTLSAINGGLSVTGGGITLSAGGAIKGGASDFSTGTGFFLGYEGGQYKFRVGDPAGARIEWNGSAWTAVDLVSIPTQVATPAISFNPESYTDPSDTSTCTITCATSGATIWYEYNGETKEYTGSFVVTKLIGVTAWAEKSGSTPSNTAWEVYEDNA